MNTPTLKILVCFYKDIYIRSIDSSYLDIQCGKDATGLDLDMQGDNVGVNISKKNRFWSEITGLYWAWRNMEKVDYVGLCSYRRFFNFKQSPGAPVRIISSKEATEVAEIDLSAVIKIFEKYDVIVPESYVYAYSIRRVCSMNYVDNDFDLLEKIVRNFSPEYYDAYRQVFYGTNRMIGHNMFILPWDRFQEFCGWVFGILFRLEKIIDPSNYSIRQVRVFGYMHEILLGVFIKHHNLRLYKSQITWITDDAKGMKFNDISYRLAAEGYYYTSKILAGADYKHKLS